MKVTYKKLIDSKGNKWKCILMELREYENELWRINVN